MNQEKGGLVCPDCRHVIPILDGLISFHPADSGHDDGMSPVIFDNLAAAEDRHFWMRARRDLISKYFEKYFNRDDRIIEVGAATGGVAKYLLRDGYKNISAGEIHLKGLEYAGKYGIRERYQFDILKAPFRDHFDVVALFDVLEHIDDDSLAVKNVHKMLKQGGRAIATVPAHRWLWCKQDAIASHRRRYELDQFTELFSDNGFRIIHATCFFVSLLPLLYMRKLLDRDTAELAEDDYKNRFRVNPVTNAVFGVMLGLENSLWRCFSARHGGSIILVAEKE